MRGPVTVDGSRLELAVPLRPGRLRVIDTRTGELVSSLRSLGLRRGAIASTGPTPRPVSSAPRTPTRSWRWASPRWG